MPVWPQKGLVIPRCYFAALINLSAALRAGRPPDGPCPGGVLVDGERDRRVGATQSLRDDLHRLAGDQQQRRVGVAGVVQPDRRQVLLPQSPAGLGHWAVKRARPRCPLEVDNP